MSKLYGNPFIDHSVVGDFDGDLKEDLALYRPSVGAWFIIRSSDHQAMQFNVGTPNIDIPVPADYDGDGYTDIAVFNPNTAVFTIRQSTTGQVITKQFGSTGDVPVVADYDSDGHADLAVFRPSNHTFYILLSGINQVFVYTTAAFKGGVPFAADVNGDGHSDLCTYNANNGKITIAYFTGAANLATQTVDMASKSILVVNDFSGDFKADAGTYDMSSGYWAVNGQLTAVGPVPVASFQFGNPPNDVPVMTIPAMLW
jgi:FG-GAP-like repeat